MTRRAAVTPIRIAGAIIGVVGFTILIWQAGWWIGIGVFMCVLGNNFEQPKL